MSLHIFRQVKSFGRGDPSDDSESWETKTSFLIVPDNEIQEFHESLADEFGNQDYSYKYSCKEVLHIADHELFGLQLALLHQTKRQIAHKGRLE